jgi:DNA-binding transcriptional regulator YiaG
LFVIKLPTPSDVKALRSASGLTQEAFGALARTNGRAVKNWESSGNEGRQMPLATWELLTLKLDKELHRKWFIESERVSSYAGFMR